MREIKFRVWHASDKKMYFRGYQKLFHILICDDDQGSNAGKGIPVKRAAYKDCFLLESTGIMDIHNREIFEGDILKIRSGETCYQGAVESVPDMFRSRRLHPLQSVLEKFHLADNEENLVFEIIGNIYESPELAGHLGKETGKIGSE